MNRFRCLASSVAAIALTVGMSMSAGAETLNWASFKSEASKESMVIAAKWWAEELEKRTNGEYKVRFHWNGSLASISEVPEAVESGIADIGSAVTPYFVDKFFLNNVLTFFLPQPHSSGGVIKLMNEWYENYPQFEQEYLKYNLKVIGLRPLGNYGILCSVPIRTADDFKGKRIRSFGRALPALIKALGGVPVTLKTTDTYEGLERGIIDCTPTDPSLAVGYKWSEVAKYFLLVPMGSTWGQHIVMNKTKFESLPKNIQDTILQLGVDHSKMYNDLLESAEKEVIDGWKADSAMEVIALPDDIFDAAVRTDPEIATVRKAWIDGANAKGVPAQKIADQLTRPSKP